MNIYRNKPVKNESVSLENQLNNTERILSLLLIEINNIKSKTKEAFLEDYKKKINILKKYVKNLYSSRKYYIKKYEKYYEISKKLSLLIKKQDKIIKEGKLIEKANLVEELNNSKTNLQKILTEYSLLKTEKDKEKKDLIDKTSNELRKYYSLSKTYQKKFEYYYNTSKELSKKLMKIERGMNENQLKKDLNQTRKKLLGIIKHLEIEKEDDRKKIQKNFEKEIKDIRKENEMLKIISESNKKKFEKQKEISRTLIDKLKKNEKENSKIKKILKKIDMKMSEQNSIYLQKLNLLKNKNEKTIESLTKDHIKREIKLNSKITLLKKDLDKYYKLYNMAKLEKIKAFEKAKNFFSEE